MAYTCSMCWVGQSSCFLLVARVRPHGVLSVASLFWTALGSGLVGLILYFGWLSCVVLARGMRWGRIHTELTVIKLPWRGAKIVSLASTSMAERSIALRPLLPAWPCSAQVFRRHGGGGFLTVALLRLLIGCRCCLPCGWSCWFLVEWYRGHWQTFESAGLK